MFTSWTFGFLAGKPYVMYSSCDAPCGRSFTLFLLYLGTMRAEPDTPKALIRRCPRPRRHWSFEDGSLGDMLDGTV